LVALAQNPSTPEAILARLAQHTEASVRAAVLRNPSAPFSVLARLGANDPGGFWENPAALLFLLEDPGLLLRPSSPLSVALASFSGTPREILQSFVLSKQEELCRAVARNPALPENLFLTLYQMNLASVRSALAQNTATPTELLRRLFQEARFYDGVPSLLAQNPATPPDLLRAMAEGEDVRLRAAVVGNPALPKEFLLRLVRLGSHPSLSDISQPDFSLRREEIEAVRGGAWLRILAAGHPAAPDELRRKVLAEIPSARFQLPSIPWLPPSFLEELGASPDATLRSYVARNPSTPEALVRALSRDALAPVRQAAAVHPALPASEWARLADDEDPSVLAALARRLDLSNEIVQRLGASPFSQVRLVVAQRQEIPEMLLGALLFDMSARVRSQAERAPKAKQAKAAEEKRLRSLRRISEDAARAALRAGTISKRALAMHLHTPLALLCELATDSAPVAYWLCAHPRLPAEVLALLAQHPSEKLRVWCAEQSHTPPEVLARMASDANRWVQRAVAQNENTPPEVLARLATHDNPPIRQLAAKNRALSPVFLETLHRAGASRSLHSFAPPDATLTDAELAPLLDLGAWAREVAGRHPNASPTTLALALEARPSAKALWIRLASHPDSQPEHLARCATCLVGVARQRAALHPRVPVSVLDLLSRAGAREDLRRLTPPEAPLSQEDRAALLSLGPWARLAVARAPWLSPSEWDRLSQDPLSTLRKVLAAFHLLRPSSAEGAPPVEVSGAS
jgi:hypothetical protein